MVVYESMQRYKKYLYKQVSIEKKFVFGYREGGDAKNRGCKVGFLW